MDLKVVVLMLSLCTQFSHCNNRPYANSNRGPQYFHQQQQRQSSGSVRHHGHPGVHFTDRQKATIRMMTERVLKTLSPNMENELQRLGDRVYGGIVKDQKKADAMERAKFRASRSNNNKQKKQLTSTKKPTGKGKAHNQQHHNFRKKG